MVRHNTSQYKLSIGKDLCESYNAPKLTQFELGTRASEIVTLCNNRFFNILDSFREELTAMAVKH